MAYMMIVTVAHATRATVCANVCVASGSPYIRTHVNAGQRSGSRRDAMRCG